MFWLNTAIHTVPSACSSRPPVGSAALRSNTPMLSSPRNPPWNTLRPLGSLRFTHQVKFSSSLANASFRNRRSTSSPFATPARWTISVANACTGGFTSLKFHS